MAKDKLTGKGLKDYFLEEMLSDPMIRLVMQADGVNDAEVRDLYSARSRAGQESAGEARCAAPPHKWSEAEDTGPRAGSGRPGIGE